MSKAFESYVEEEIYWELEGANDIFGDNSSYIKIERIEVEELAHSNNPFHVANKIKKELKNYYSDGAIIEVRFTKNYYKIDVYYVED